MNYKAVNIDTGENQLRKGSVVSYPERGPYGKTNYRGNCTGEIIKDLLTFYKPTKWLECYAGSGTGLDVAKSLGITNSVHLDLNPQFGGFDLLTDEFPTGYDFCFSHPPYWTMIPYSNFEYKLPTNEPHQNDISHTESYEDFIKQLDKINLKVYQSLVNGGRHALLISDIKKNGKYYSPFKDMQFYGDLESHVVKVQHNTYSSRKNYANYNFIPIAHENLIVLKKNSVWQVPITVVKKITRSLKDSLLMTWRDLIASALQEFGGKASLSQLYKAIEDTQKAKQNEHFKEKIRQTLQINSNFEAVERGVWKLSIA